MGGDSPGNAVQPNRISEAQQDRTSDQPWQLRAWSVDRFHGRILIVVDEAPGVKAEIWEAIEGIRAGGDVRVLALGNPTIASGPFYDAFTANRDGWCTFTISAFDSPNLAGLSLGDLLTLPEAEISTRSLPGSARRRERRRAGIGYFMAKHLLPCLPVPRHRPLYAALRFPCWSTQRASPRTRRSPRNAPRALTGYRSVDSFTDGL